MPATDAPTRHVRRFSTLSRHDIRVAGRAGANLGEMTRALLPVPPGFVVTVAAYDRFSTRTGLRAAIARLLRSVDFESPQSIEATARAIRQIAGDANIPEEIRDDIVAAYRQLGGPEAAPSVAVWLSGSGADAADSALARMDESNIGVSGEQALLERILACWGSAFGAQEICRRVKQGFPADPALAVIVQRTVESVKSGVMVTANLATNDRSQIVVEATRRMGEALSADPVTPDRYILDKATLMVMDREIAENSIGIQSAVLTDREIHTLGALACKSEVHYGKPQMLEFAIDVNGKIFLLRSKSCP
jgi:pyruvate,water dikinase